MQPLNTENRVHPDSSPQDVLRWIQQKYAAPHIVLTTSFGMEGCALIDMVSQLGLPLTVANIDTGFLFDQTKKLRQDVADRYSNLRFETWEPALTVDEQSRFWGKNLWERDPQSCCKIRKIDPLQKQIGRFQIWITGIRKSQSEQRKSISPIQWDWQNNLLKICPLANWERSDVWEYVQANNVPYNPLHEQGYPSIGCTHCTRKVDGLVQLSDYSREGRWSGTGKTECGLHFDGSTCSGKAS